MVFPEFLEGFIPRVGGSKRVLRCFCNFAVFVKIAD